MISAVLLALSAPAAIGTAAFGADPASHPQGHVTKHKAPVVACNPDPLKGRACRNHQAKAEAEHRELLAEADRSAPSEARNR